MLLRRLGLVVAVALACTACKKGRAKRSAKRGNAAPAIVYRSSGAAHGTNIDRVTLSVDGKVAVSRDTEGGLRLWPKLDGSAEPIAVPARGAQHFSAATSAQGGWVVATVEASGQAVFTRVMPNGKTQQLIALPPFDPLVEAHVLPGGDKVLTLHRDASIRLLRTNGQEIGRYSRRKFSPSQLRVSADGSKVVAIESGARTGESIEVVAYPIDITGNPQRLFVGKDAVRLRSTFEPTPDSLALSPDGRRLVTLTPNRSQRELIALVFDLAAAGRRRSFPTTLPVSSRPTVGFVGPESIAVSTVGRGGSAFQIDLRTGRTVPRRGPPDGVRGVSTGRGLQIGAYDAWLFVQDMQRSTQRYLGFEAFHPSSVAFSPSGQWVAWGTMRSQIYIEPFSGPASEPQKIESDVSSPIDRLFFASENRVLASFSGRRVALIDWKEDRVIDETSIEFRSGVSVEYEPDTKLLLINGSRDGKLVVEVDPERGFQGQHILPDPASRAGLLTRAAGKAMVVWTADRDDSKLRMYPLADLRRGMSPEEVKEKGALMPPGDLLRIDRSGGRYVFDRGRLTVMRGAQTATVELPTQGVLPSWDSRRVFAVVSDGHRDLRVVTYDSSKMEEVWTQRMPVHITGYAWSQDGSHVALATESGGVVFDARTGERVGARCGMSFESRGAPPPRESRSSGRSLCDG